MVNFPPSVIRAIIEAATHAADPSEDPATSRRTLVSCLLVSKVWSHGAEKIRGILFEEISLRNEDDALEFLEATSYRPMQFATRTLSLDSVTEITTRRVFYRVVGVQNLTMVRYRIIPCDLFDYPSLTGLQMFRLDAQEIIGTPLALLEDLKVYSLNLVPRGVQKLVVRGRIESLEVNFATPDLTSILRAKGKTLRILNVFFMWMDDENRTLLRDLSSCTALEHFTFGGAPESVPYLLQQLPKNLKSLTIAPSTPSVHTSSRVWNKILASPEVLGFQGVLTIATADGNVWRRVEAEESEEREAGEIKEIEFRRLFA